MQSARTKATILFLLDKFLSQYEKLCMAYSTLKFNIYISTVSIFLKIFALIGLILLSSVILISWV